MNYSNRQNLIYLIKRIGVLLRWTAKGFEPPKLQEFRRSLEKDKKDAQRKLAELDALPSCKGCGQRPPERGESYCQTCSDSWEYR